LDLSNCNCHNFLKEWLFENMSYQFSLALILIWRD
jgi:hypothetical protein